MFSPFLIPIYPLLSVVIAFITLYGFVFTSLSITSPLLALDDFSNSSTFTLLAVPLSVNIVIYSRVLSKPFALTTTSPFKLIDLTPEDLIPDSGTSDTSNQSP